MKQYITQKELAQHLGLPCNDKGPTDSAYATIKNWIKRSLIATKSDGGRSLLVEKIDSAPTRPYTKKANP